MTIPTTTNIKASTINREGFFGEKRQFSYSQYWPNVIEQQGDWRLSMNRMRGKSSAYNVYVSGFLQNFPYNSTPVIRITDNGSNDGDPGLFPFMTDDDWFSVDVAFYAGNNRSLLSNEVFRVFFKCNSNGLTDIPFIKDPVHTIAGGYYPAREWVAIDNDVLVDFNAINARGKYDWVFPPEDQIRKYTDLQADTAAIQKAVQFGYDSNMDTDLWVATYVDGMTSFDYGVWPNGNPARIVRRYALMDTTQNSYNWVAIGPGRPNDWFSITPTAHINGRKDNIGSISGDWRIMYNESEPMPRGGSMYGHKIGDIIYKRERTPNGSGYHWMMYRLESISLVEGEPLYRFIDVTSSYRWFNYSKYFRKVRLKSITNETISYNVSVKQWVREYQDVFIYDGDKIVSSLPFADNYPIGSTIFLHYYNYSNQKWQYDKYNLVTSTSPYEPNDRYEDFENYGNFQSNYYGSTSRKFGWYDEKYKMNRGCQVYEWNGNNASSNKKRWMLTNDYNPSLKKGNPQSYDVGQLPNPNTLETGTTILYKPYSTSNYEYFTVVPDTTQVFNHVCRVFYHPGNKEVWASAQYNGDDNYYTRCQAIIRRVIYWPYGTSTKDQVFPNYYTYTGQKIATTADGISQNILDLFEEIYFRPPDLETALALQSTVNSGIYTIDEIRQQMNAVIPTNQPWNSRIFNTNQKLRVKMARTWEEYNQKYTNAFGTEIQTHVNGYDDVRWANKNIGFNGLPPNVRSTVSDLEWNFYVNT